MVTWNSLLDNSKQKETFRFRTKNDLVHLIVDGIINRYALISSAMVNNIAEESCFQQKIHRDVNQTLALSQINKANVCTIRWIYQVFIPD